jgi:hypothetical protein
MTDRPRALAVLIAVFLMGCIIGAGGSYLWLKKNQDQARSTMQGFPSGPSPQGRQRMQELLQLTPEQESQFSKIMAESRRQMDAVRAQDQPKIEAIFTEQQPKIEAIAADTNRKVMSILNKDQQAKFESLWKEMGSRRRGPPHGGRETRHPPQRP